MYPTVSLGSPAVALTIAGAERRWADCGCDIDGEHWRCLPCREKRRRPDRDRRKGIEAVGRWERPQQIDPEPCRRLRVRLQELRRAGVGFDEAWPAAVGGALAGLSNKRGTRDEWRYILESTRSGWRHAYERSGLVLPLTSVLLSSDVPDPPDEDAQLVA